MCFIDFRGRLGESFSFLNGILFLFNCYFFPKSHGPLITGSWLLAITGTSQVKSYTKANE